ncbi:MAG: cytochrome c oxidase subunit II, partial [Candidatus Eremiobacterota bacterium]
MKRAARVLMLALAGLTLGACALDGPQSGVAPLGPVADRQYYTFLVSFYVSLLIFVCVGSLIVYSVLRFRHKGEIDRNSPLPDQSHGSTRLEMALIAISIVLVLVIVVPSVQGMIYAGTLQNPEEDVLVINVTGYQWWWKFEYPKEGVVTANEVAIPVGKPIKFNLATNDVIHSFWVPRLAGKVDMMPNQKNWLWLQAVTPGEYYGQCVEFCGESHAFMRFRVRALESNQYQDWVTHQKSDAKAPVDPLARRGKDLFKAKFCVGCHMIRGDNPGGNVAPDLTHFGSRGTLAAGLMENNAENLARWLTDPGSIKPGNMMAAAFMHPDPRPEW